MTDYNKLAISVRASVAKFQDHKTHATQEAVEEQKHSDAAEAEKELKDMMKPKAWMQRGISGVDKTEIRSSSHGVCSHWKTNVGSFAKSFPGFGFQYHQDVILPLSQWSGCTLKAWVPKTVTSIDSK